MLPKFAVTLPQDALLQSSPPFDFPGVSMRIFPLRADITRLQSLVDGWVNRLVPPEIAYFRAFSPLITLVALHYGRAASIPENLGWSSQREITFSIPLQWYRETRNGFELLDLAVLTPFIFVDNDLSIPAGREVFGWQKNRIYMESLSDRWMQNPRAPTKHAGISTQTFREVYAGQQAKPIPFVSISEAPAGAMLQYPPDKRNPLLPWVSLSNSMGAARDLTLDLLNLLAGLGLARRRDVAGEQGRRRWLDQSPAETLGSLLGSLGGVDPYSMDLYANEINLKQFRDAERPTNACYQDVNCTVMRIREVNRAGLLGETRILAGDITGGYRITLHQWESLPIADMLGLECKEGVDASGSTIVTLTPVIPMWADIDLGYADERHVIAYRSGDPIWRPGRREKRSSARVSVPRRSALDDSRESIVYNTTLGSSSPVLYGPFEMPRATIRVLPLLATPSKLEELCDRALNGPLGALSENGRAGGRSGISFAPWGSYVYLVITTADETYSVDNNVGSWSSSRVSFLVPVQRFSDGEPDGFALYSPFNFYTSPLDVVSASEINGVRVLHAQIDSPSSAWLLEDGPLLGRGRDLAVIHAMIPPLINAGERAQMRAILRISQRGEETPQSTEEELDPLWAPIIKHDIDQRPQQRALPSVPQKRHPMPGMTGKVRVIEPAAPASDLDIARACAINFISGGQPFRFVALKQFRDVARPDRACYQSLVEVEQRLLSVKRIEEIHYPVDVTIFDYESMPIAKVLGLRPRSGGFENGLLFHRFEPIRPFWGNVKLREEIGRNLAEQMRHGAWTRRGRPIHSETETEPSAAAAPDTAHAVSESPPTPAAGPPTRTVPTVPGTSEVTPPKKVKRASGTPQSPPKRSEVTLAESLAGLKHIDLREPHKIQAHLTIEAGKRASKAESASGGAYASMYARTPSMTDVSDQRRIRSALTATEPQWILESILSREWESRSMPIWRYHQERIRRSSLRARAGFKSFTKRALDEIAELVAERTRVSNKPHADILEEIDKSLLPRFVAVRWLWAEARHLNELDAAAAMPAITPPPRKTMPSGALEPMALFDDDSPHQQVDEPQQQRVDESGFEGFRVPQADSLYQHDDFSALEQEDPDLVRRAESVLQDDPVLGHLLETAIRLGGSAAAQVVHEYKEKHPVPREDASPGSVSDVMMSFLGEDTDGDGVPDILDSRPFTGSIPSALRDGMNREATAMLATARTFVLRAWQNCHLKKGEPSPEWANFLNDAGRTVTTARRELILALAKCWQKPFFCVRRDTAGSVEIAVKLFPISQCFKDRVGVRWYCPDGSPPGTKKTPGGAYKKGT